MGNQQEFVPDPQSNGQKPVEDDEVYYPQYPYSWSGKLDNEAVPRDEPPSSYAESARQPGYSQGYRAQDSTGRAQQQSGWQGQGGQPGQQGTTRNQGTQRQGVPPWARPQQHRRRPLRFGFILLILLAIVLIQGIFSNGGLFVGAAGDIFGAIFGLLLFIILVPLFVVAIVLGIFLRAVRFGGPWYGRRRWRRRSWPNGPFWW